MTTKLDLTIVQYATFEQLFTLYADDGKTSRLNLTDHTIRAEAKDTATNGILPETPYNLNPVVVDAANGELKIELAPAQTAAFTTVAGSQPRPVWDMVVLTPEGKAYKVFQGDIKVETSVTNPLP